MAEAAISRVLCKVQPTLHPSQRTYFHSSLREEKEEENGKCGGGGEEGEGRGGVEGEGGGGEGGGGSIGAACNRFHVLGGS